MDQIKDDEVFGKIRAAIGLRSVPARDPDFPEDVVKAGASAFVFLRRLLNRNEKLHGEQCHQLLTVALSNGTISFAAEGPSGVRVTPFSQKDNSNNCFTYLVKTEQLFGAAPSTNEEAKIDKMIGGTLAKWQLDFQFLTLFWDWDADSSDEDDADNQDVTLFASPSALITD